MYRHFKNLNLVLLVTIVVVHCGPFCAAQEGFREPSIPAAEPDVSNLENIVLDRSATQQAPRQSVDGFVPATAPETRLTPVAPKGTRPQDAIVSPPGLLRENSYRPNIDSDTGNLEPILPGRANLRSVIEGLEEFENETSEESAGPEVIRQRYPDGKTQVLREVAQDREGNYFNHGDWKLFNRQGQVLAEGRFQNGLMNGVWQRWHPTGSSGIFSTPPFNKFQGPFLSRATFSDGNLDGVWSVMDHYERKVFDIPYTNGQRNGEATWWYPSSMKMREVTFKDGLIDGTIREWNEQNRLVRQDEYIEGKKIVRQTTFYRPKQKQSENIFLDQQLEPAGSDDWWNARPASFNPTGQKLQHGPAYAWYENGQPKMKGQYKDNVRVGLFTWWHPNGQKQLSGNYDELGNKVGKWSWWHSNGIRAIQGQYANDEPSGVWRWWNEDGQVTNEEDMDLRVEEPQEPEEANEDSADDDEASETSEPFIIPDVVPENAAEFRDPDRGEFDESENVVPQGESSILGNEDGTENMEEIFGEGETDVLPEKLVPDEGGINE